ncbi:MAG: O-antigen ligase family protein, partial [Planctomycetales bacterium]|nr:O-antigen ligase family protein [Planctomycetales bacterium]
QSRGGMLVAAIVVAFGAAGTWQRSEDWRKQSARLGLIVGAIVVGLLVHGLSDVTQEASTLTSGSIERLDKGAGRRQIWRSAREILGQFTLTGAGVGSFRNAYPLYYAEPREYDYGYAESGYLNVAAETGLAGLGVLCAALGILMRRSIPLVLASWQRRWGDEDDRELVTAAACGVMASAVHSLFDFVWFVPACWVATVCLIVVVLRLHQLSAAEVDERTSLLTDRARHRTSHAGVQPIGLAFAGAFLLLVAVRGVSLAAAAIHWDAYLIAIRQDENEQEFFLTATDSRVEIERLAMAHQRLRKIVQLDPSVVPARVHLSAVCLQRFELEQAMSDNPMSLAQIRDAALSSAFISLEQQNKWLDAVMSDRKLFLLEAAATTRSILALAPFQGRAYVDLAELSFLEKLGGLDRSQLIQQALRVRPHDGMVLFAAGREAALSGDFAACVRWWQHAYRQDRKLRLTITTQLAPLLPAPAFLDSFAPTLPDLVTLQQMYQHRQQVDDALFVARAYVERLTAGSAEEQTTAYDWQQGYRLAAELQDPRALMIARHAVELDPLNDVMRRRLAYEQLEHGQLSAAIQNLETYIRSNPADKRTAEKLAWAKQEARRL